MDGNWLSQVDESSPGRGNSMALRGLNRVGGGDP